MHPLMSADELGRALHDGSALAADVRWYLDGRRGQDAYQAGHIPGAIFVDVDTVLAGPPGSGPGRHPLPSPEHFARAMSALGFSDHDFVVAYDDAGGSIAARLWWMLTRTGRRAAVLDGGIAAWTEPLETGHGAPRPPGSFTPRPWPANELVDAAGVEELRAVGATLLDARAAERYRGDVEPIDPRGGHIPGARSAPWSDNVDGDGRFRNADDLADRFRALGAGSDTTTVAYCGSGITACHNILALDVAGIRGALLYEGSWSDWSSDPSRPAATGESG